MLPLEDVLTFHDLDGLASTGAHYAAANPTALDRRPSDHEDDLFTIIYTSGTTGPPKGCMLSHRNYYAMVRVVEMDDRLRHPDDVMLLYLPLAHNYGRLMLLSGRIRRLHDRVPADPLRVAEALPHVRPTLLPSVPRVYEKVHSAVLAASTPPPGRSGASSTGRSPSDARLASAPEKRPVPARCSGRHRVADRLVFTKVRIPSVAGFGSRAGGAPLSKDIMEFFHGIGILIPEGYGLTECTTAAHVTARHLFRFGSVGKPLPGRRVRIAEDGEILLRSETVFAGYYKETEATAAMLGADGWLKTGDIGISTRTASSDHRPQEGHSRHRRRQERRASEHRERPEDASQSSHRRWSSATAALRLRARSPSIREIDAGGRSGRCRRVLTAATSVSCPPEGVVDDVNRERSRFEQVKRFTILPRDFTMDAGRDHARPSRSGAEPYRALRSGDRRAVRRAIRRPRETASS